MLLPLAWKYEKPNSVSHGFVPFYAYGQQDSTRKYLVVTPFYWQNSTANSASKTFAPFVWHKKEFTTPDSNRTSTQTYIFPTIFYAKERLFDDSLKYRSGSSKFYIHPILYQSTDYRYNDNKDSIKNDAYYKRSTFNFIPLLYFSEKFKHGSTLWSYRVQFPIYWQDSSHDEKLLTVFPLFSNKSVLTNGRNHLLVTPLFWHTHWVSHGQELHNKYSTTLFPLYWHKETPNYHFHSIMPIYGYRKSTAGKQVLAVTPLFWNKIDTAKNSRLTMLLPLAWKSEKPNSISHGFLPFYTYSQKHYSAKSWLSDSRSIYVFPIFWNSHEKYSKKETKKTTAFPIWWSRTDINSSNDSTSYSHRVLFPLVWNYYRETPRYFTAKKPTRHFTVFPVYWQKSTLDTVDYRVLFPVYWQSRNSHTVFPLFSYGREHLVITPLFWNVKNNHSHTQMLLPLYYFKHDNDSKRVHLFPLVWTKQSENKRYFHLLPLYSQLSDSVSTYRYVLGPVFAQRRTNTELRNSVLGALYQWNRKEDEDYQRRVLYRFIYRENWDGVRTFGIAPFFHISKNENSSFSKNFGFGFYSHFRRKVVGYENEFYEETKMFWFLRMRSNYQYLKNKGIDAR
jgi:hypothetical protein